MSNYPDMLAPALGTLVGAMTQWREQRIREGGTAWRGVAPGRIAIGRTAVLALSALACQLRQLVPVVGDGLASGAGWGPVGDYLGFALGTPGADSVCDGAQQKRCLHKTTQNAATDLL